MNEPYDGSIHIPIHASLAVLNLMTTEQREAVTRLLRKPTVQKITLGTDSWTKGITFNLFGNRGPDDCFLSGLILPEGSVHT